jgi:hypothetical protein
MAGMQVDLFKWDVLNATLCDTFCQWLEAGHFMKYKDDLQIPQDFISQSCPP